MLAIRTFRDAWNVVLERAAAIFGLALAGVAVVFLLDLLAASVFEAQAMGLDLTFGSRTAVIGVLVVLASLVFSVMIMGSISALVFSQRKGDRIGVEQAIRQFGEFWGRAVVTAIVSALLLLLVAIPSVIGTFVVVARSLSGAFSFVVLTIIWLPAIYVSVGLSVALQAAVLEGRMPFEAIGRSWTLVSRHRGDVFLLALLAGGIFGGVSFVSRLGGSGSIATGPVSMGIGLVVETIVVGFGSVVWASLFFNLAADELEGRKIIGRPMA